MRVALVTADWPTHGDGGVATFARTLRDGLEQAGAECEVWTRGGGPRAAALGGERGVRGLPGRSWRRWGARHWARGLPPLVERFDPEAVIVSPWEPLLGGRGALDLRGARGERRARGGRTMRVVAHGREVLCALDPARERARRQLLAGGLRWLTLTRWLRDELIAREVPAADIAVVPAAVATGHARLPPSEPEASLPTMLALGRLIPRKGQDVAIASVALLKGRGVDVALRIVGAGPDAGRLAALVERFGVSDRVVLTGPLPEAEAWRGIAGLVLPTRDQPGDVEGFGLVFLEAGLRQLPVLGGRTGGVPEAILDGVTGLLVDQPQDPAAVAAAIERLLVDGAAWGAAGRRRALAQHQPGDLGRAVLQVLQQDRAGP